MNIVVLVKQVPDTYEDRKLNLETGLASREESERVLDEIGERAVEVALSYRDAGGDAQITVVTVGPSPADAAMRKALAMGADRALHVLDDELLGADLVLTADVLSAALRHVGFDLVITGNQSTDGSGGVMAAMVAEILAIPALTWLSRVELDADSVSGQRAVDGGVMEVSTRLPAIVSVTEALPEARFPSFKGIMAAKKKPIETVSLSDLNTESTDITTPRSIMLEVAMRPPRAAGMKIVDEGDAGQKLATFLVENRLA